MPIHVISQVQVLKDNSGHLINIIEVIGSMSLNLLKFQPKTDFFKLSNALKRSKIGFSAGERPFFLNNSSFQQQPLLVICRFRLTREGVVAQNYTDSLKLNLELIFFVRLGRTWDGRSFRNDWHLLITNQKLDSYLPTGLVRITNKLVTTIFCNQGVYLQLTPLVFRILDLRFLEDFLWRHNHLVWKRAAGAKKKWA